VDIEKFEQEITSRREREKEFERIYGKQVRQIRQKRAVVGVVVGVIFGILSLAVSWWFGNAMVSGWDCNLSMVWSSFWSSRVVIGLVAVYLFILGRTGYIFAAIPGRQEKELRKSFGL
jgi:hypothetical protein